jgi:hypothetical protein
MRCGWRGASPADIEGFLRRVATPDWIGGLLGSVSPGGLAGALLALATTLEPAQRAPFLREALARRVTQELSRRGARDAEAWAQALSLLGAASAIGLRGPVPQARWPAERELAEVLAYRAPDTDRTTIGPFQITLWLGLREMARWRADAVKVSPPLAGRVLDLWQAADQGEVGQDLRPHVRALNAAMIAWLQRCKAAGWRLVPPEPDPDPPLAADNPAGRT